MTSFIRNIGSDLISLFYPALCAGCGNTLVQGEQYLCLSCHINLPRTRFLPGDNNEAEKLFRGRVPIEASSFLYFRKGGLSQSLLHQLKYKGSQELGEYLATLFGRELQAAEVLRKADLVLPVPIHRRKRLQRGYNQSDSIASGIAGALSLPLEVSLLERLSATATQTKKKRFERWENVASVFRVKPGKEALLEGKYVILADDVMTTGATIEACAAVLLENGATGVCALSLALAC